MKEPIWVRQETIIKTHDIQIAEHGGLPGTRDENLLLSALARPQNLFAYGTPSIFELAATLTYGIAKNHPFFDANKRTAYLAGRIFLEINGFSLISTPEEKLTMMVALAEGQISEKEFAAWLEKNSVSK